MKEKCIHYRGYCWTAHDTYVTLFTNSMNDYKHGCDNHITQIAPTESEGWKQLLHFCDIFNYTWIQDRTKPESKHDMKYNEDIRSTFGCDRLPGSGRLVVSTPIVNPFSVIAWHSYISPSLLVSQTVCQMCSPCQPSFSSLDSLKYFGGCCSLLSW